MRAPGAGPRDADHEPHFFTEPSLIEEGRATLEGADARHLAVVRRARPGDRIRVSDGEGTVHDVRIERVTVGRVEGEVLASRAAPRVLPETVVFQGLARSGKLDLVVQKLVEVGVDGVVVFRAGRSVPRWDPDRDARALDRWRTIAREAAKQSRRAWLPMVDGPVAVAEAAARAGRAGLALVAHERSGRRLREVLPGEAPGSVAMVVGPEGGLSEEEVEAFRGAGAEAVTLGGQVLRTETAGLVAAALVMYHFERIG